MITKTIFSLAASIIKFIIFYFFFLNANADTVNKKYEPNEKGILALMYHRFEENKYPSTNIKIDIFKEHLNIIRDNNFSFLNPKNFELEFNRVSEEKKILLTIDDAFSSFYLNAWPILKRDKIPFILFVSTEAVGKNGYMSWDEIIEISKEDFVFIGNHSHSHEYLVKYGFEEFKKDILKSIELFKINLGYNSKFFSFTSSGIWEDNLGNYGNWSTIVNAEIENNVLKYHAFSLRYSYQDGSIVFAKGNRTND